MPSAYIVYIQLSDIEPPACIAVCLTKESATAYGKEIREQITKAITTHVTRLKIIPGSEESPFFTQEKHPELRYHNATVFSDFRKAVEGIVGTKLPGRSRWQHPRDFNTMCIYSDEVPLR